MHERINFGHLPVQNKPNKIKTFIEICKRKKKYEKRIFETFRTQGLFNYWDPVDLPFRFELYRKKLYASKTP